MNRIRTIIYKSSISIIIFWLLMPLLKWITKLEFANNTLKSNCESFFFFAIPLAILLTLVKTIKKTDVLSEIIAKSVVTIVIAFCTVAFTLFSIFLNICSWYDGKVLFQNELDSDIVIIERDYGCGAWDSGPVSSKLFKMTKYGIYFISTSEIDTSKIDKTVWKRMDYINRLY